MGKYKWLISPRWFIRLIGAEYGLLNQAGTSAIKMFYISAVVILLILATTILSISYAVKLLFHMLHMEILLASFFSILFVLMYIYLLHTFSKELKNDTAKKTIYEKVKSVQSADIVRTLFVFFMAFLISKPIEVFFLSKSIDPQIDNYREGILSNYKEKITQLYSIDLKKTELRIQQLEAVDKKYSTDEFKTQIAEENESLNRIKEKFNNSIYNASVRIDKTDFLLHRIKLASSDFRSWLICLIVIILFLLPGLLFFIISSEDKYFELKREMEKSLIDSEFKKFKLFYSQVFNAVLNEPKEYYSAYEDPPYNKTPIPKPVYGKQDDFLKYFE